MKKSVILAASVAAIMAGTAVADATVYGRARMAFVQATVEDGSTATGYADSNGVQNDSSRVGVKGSEDLGNGMSAIYHYEFGYNADENGSEDLSNRIGVVGLKGDFGTVAVGNMWVPSYNLVRGAVDPFNHFGESSGYIQGSRAGDAIAYVNKFGSVDLQAAVISSDNTEETVDGYDIAVAMPVGPVNVALSLGNSKDTAVGAVKRDTKHTGLAVVYSNGPLTAGIGILSSSDITDESGVGKKLDGDSANDFFADFSATVLLAAYKVSSAGSVLFRYTDATFDLDVAGAADLEASSMTLGYHHNMSKRTQGYVEYKSGSLDMTGATFTGEDEDYILGSGLAIGLKHNF